MPDDTDAERLAAIRLNHGAVVSTHRCAEAGPYPCEQAFLLRLLDEREAVAGRLQAVAAHAKRQMLCEGGTPDRDGYCSLCGAAGSAGEQCRLNVATPQAERGPPRAAMERAREIREIQEANPWIKTKAIADALTAAAQAAKAEQEARLDRYRYAVTWAASDSWDGGGDVRRRFEWAATGDPDSNLSTDRIAEIGRQFLDADDTRSLSTKGDGT